MDGVQIQPKDADTIVLCAGQTSGVVVQGKTNPTGGELLIIKMLLGMTNFPFSISRSQLHRENDD
jgi:iron transport multicopper oxidase